MDPIRKDGDWTKFNDEMNLYNPKSKGAFMLLWLYSIEPPFYYYLNKACRQLDSTLLPLLGPFAAAILFVLRGTTEYFREDSIKSGFMLHNPESLYSKGKGNTHPLGYLCSTFLVFRGVSLNPETILQWISMIGLRRYTDQ